MSLFPYGRIVQLSVGELRVYDYLLSHLGQAKDMTIRQLSEATGVSTTTILRFCEKIGCDGYQELRYRLAREASHAPASGWSFPNDQAQVYQFLRFASEDANMERNISIAAELLAWASTIHLVGVGTSGNLAEYGARYFANLGIPNISVLDSFYPNPTYDLTGNVLVALSVSGETEQVLIQTESHREHGSKVISITNTAECGLARISDVNLNYYMPVVFPPKALGPHNVTTQLPALYYLETLARRACLLKHHE